VKLQGVSVKVTNATAEEQSKLIDAAIRASEANRRKPKGRK